MALAGCGGESTEMKTYLFFYRGEEENKSPDMALAGCGGESTEPKTYLLYIVEKKRTKATAWLMQAVAERVHRRMHTSFLSWRRREQRRPHGSCRLWRREYREEDIPLVCSGEEDNKYDNMALAGCGGESTETKTYFLYLVEKKRTKATPLLLQVVEERVQRRRHTFLL
jgi:hypothetical protein